MGSKWVLVLVLFMFVSLQGCLSQISGCWEEERVALLQLKHFFNRPNNPYYPAAEREHKSGWPVEGERNSDCCQWKRVECNKRTGRVIRLDLQEARDWELREGYLNASLFSAFQQLQHLDLSSNSIAGFIENKGSDKVLRLSNLEHLNLGYNMFNNNIFSSLGALSSLKYLFLNDNGLKGVVNVSGLDSLYNLELLDMSNNEIGKLIFPKGLRGLKYLHLKNVSIHDDLIPFLSLVSIPFLKRLDLSYNNFSEMTTTQEYLYNFTNLEDLWLYGSSLHISVLQSIVVLTSPRELWMQTCQVNGVLGSQEYLTNFTTVERLTLDGCSLHIRHLQFIGAFTSLNFLSMRSCQLNGILDFQGSDRLLSSLGALSSLKQLFLSDNRLKGIVDVPDSLNNLEVMDMSNNEIDKFVFRKGLKLEYLYLQNISIDEGISSLLHSLASLPSLRMLDLSFNNFSDSTTTQDGSSQVHVDFTSLDTLVMQNCQLYGTPSFQDLPNLKNLKSLFMDHTSLDLGFLQKIGPMTSLETLSLSNCGLQSTLLLEDDGVIPKFLYHQQYLQFLDFSNNDLTGGFPNWLLENNTELNYLSLANNLLGGYLSIHSHMNLTTLDISNNSFQGHIPNEVAEYLPDLILLNLSRNHFDGTIPTSIGDMNSLHSLDLSYNNLSGEIPEHLAEGCTSLWDLRISNNKLRGKIFSAKFNLTKLMTLQLNGNSFTGSIPDSLSKASGLVGLYLGDNKLSGTIPSWLGNISSLKDVIMPNNHFEGPIPLEFCQFQSLRVLNLAENNLSGNLPSCFSPLSITHVHLSKNKLHGQLKEAFFYSSSLVTLDLGYNRFDGSIPTWIGRLSQLTYLILSKNNLEGDVPIQLCQLNQLRLVDLSQNNLSGYIPNCLDFTALHSSGQEVASPFCSKILLNCSRIKNNEYLSGYLMNRIEESVEFTTKTYSYSYHGKVLTYMSGVDLSCNKLTGRIPPQVGNLTGIHTLNLSHNNLTGPIPLTFSKLKQIESLDLSYNNLNGKIPPQLIELYTLSSFNVAHNNLSGRTPEIAQFNTFGENSYEGNPLLCRPPLDKNCETTRPPSPMPGPSTDKEEDNDLMDIFFMSFIGSYIIVLLGIAAVLYINPYWRRVWFYLIEKWMTSCYYFIVDNFPHRFCH
ncbi:hypothetical protein Ddye_028791 [Dipteronia dyeriana]|uniref:Leucine-rich repeat-containing N-terminal plant-type domain-containing protein n=1 Tax=Dipteronia dyeriana TaxID=168575 RepID=A0AAD9TD80_9ROSI|nr:hypothetical protein Ddye_028791 [Dipteronia dyeriana]